MEVFWDSVVSTDFPSPSEIASDFLGHIQPVPVWPRIAKPLPVSAQAQWEEELTSPGAGRKERASSSPSSDPFEFLLSSKAAGGRKYGLIKAWVLVLPHCEPFIVE